MSAPSVRAEAVRGIRWTLVASVGGVVAQAAQLVVLGRVLAPADFGLMGLLVVVSGFALAYTDLGIGAAVVRRRDATRQELSSLYWTTIALGLVVCAAAWLAAPAYAAVVREPALVRPMRAVALTFVVVPLGKQFEMLLQRELRFDVLARVEVLSAAAGTAVAIGTALAGAGFWAPVAGLLTAAVVKALQLCIVGWRSYRPLPRFRRDDLRGYLAFGLYQAAEQTVNYLGERIDQLLLGRLLGVGPLGYYNFAFNLASQPLTRVNPLVTRVAYPTFCRVQDDAPRLRAGFVGVVRLLSTVNAPLLAGLAAVAPALVPLVFGPQWKPSVPLVQLLCALAMVRSLGNPIGSLLLARGRADLGFRLNVLLLALNVPAAVVGARLGGAVGVVVGLLAVQLLLLPVSYVWILQPIIGDSARDYARAGGRPVLLALFMAACMAVVADRVTHGPPAATVLAQAAVGALVYVAALLGADRPTARELAGFAGLRL